MVICINLLLSKIHSEWIEKFCHAKIKDRLSSLELLQVDKDDGITSRTLNLRDKLIVGHVKGKKDK